MANSQNLRPLNTRTQRERKEIAKKGAAASNKAQAEKRALRSAANLLLSMPADKNIKSRYPDFKLSSKDYTLAAAMVIAQVEKALQGNTRAFNAIRDIIGENPTNCIDVESPDNDKIINLNIMAATLQDLEAE